MAGRPALAPSSISSFSVATTAGALAGLDARLPALGLRVAGAFGAATALAGEERTGVAVVVVVDVARDGLPGVRRLMTAGRPPTADSAASSEAISSRATARRSSMEWTSSWMFDMRPSYESAPGPHVATVAAAVLGTPGRRR